MIARLRSDLLNFFGGILFGLGLILLYSHPNILSIVVGIVSFGVGFFRFYYIMDYKG